MSNQLLFVGIAGGLAAAIGLALVFSAIVTQSTAQMMGHQGMMGSTMGPGMMTTQSTGTPWQWNQRSMFNANGMSPVDNVQITGVSITGSDEVAVSLRYDGSETSPAVTVIAITNPMMMHGSMGRSSGMMGMGGMDMMHGGNTGTMGSGMIYGGYGYSPTLTNNTQWQQWHDQMGQWNNLMAQWHGQLNSTQWAQMQAWHNQMMTQGTMVPGSTWLNGTSTWPGQFTAYQSQTGSSVLNAGWASDATVKVKLEGDGSAYDGSGIHAMVFPLTS